MVLDVADTGETGFALICALIELNPSIYIFLLGFPRNSLLIEQTLRSDSLPEKKQLPVFTLKPESNADDESSKAVIRIYFPIWAMRSSPKEVQ